MKNYYKISIDGTLQIGSGTVIPQGFTEYIIGKEPQDLLDARAVEAVALAYQELKSQRSTAVDSIEVTYNGVIYQGDELSQGRLSRAISALPDDTTTTTWVAKDNSVHQLTRVDLKTILALSGAEQSRLWNLGRP